MMFCQTRMYLCCSKRLKYYASLTKHEWRAVWNKLKIFLRVKEQTNGFRFVKYGTPKYEENTCYPLLFDENNYGTSSW